jgi:hypothetical protein
MIKTIRNELNLAPFIREPSECCYDGKVELSYIDIQIKDDSVVALAPDNYYNSLRLANTPPAVDHLAILLCPDGRIGYFLIEDKNVKTMKGINANHIYRKFKTTIEDFMAKRFDYIFLSSIYTISCVELYLVTNFGLRKPRDNQSKKDPARDTRLEILQSMRPLKFQGRLFSIKHSYPRILIKIPNEN